MHEDNHNTPTITTKYCKNGCGFFGTQEMNDLCSKCFRESQQSNQPKQKDKKEQSSIILELPTSEDDGEPARKIRKEVTEEEEKSSHLSLEYASSKDTSQDSDSSTRSRSPTRNRCHICNRKVGLTGYHCRCGGLYCGEHRYSDRHDCDFDYRSEGRERIRKNNPKVTSRKVEDI